MAPLPLQLGNFEPHTQLWIFHGVSGQPRVLPGVRIRGIRSALPRLLLVAQESFPFFSALGGTSLTVSGSRFSPSVSAKKSKFLGRIGAPAGWINLDHACSCRLAVASVCALWD